MPVNDNHYVAYSMKDIFFGKYGYDKTSGKTTYSDQRLLGHGINATFDFRFAEGRLYASGTLRKFLKKLTGGTISLGVEDLTLAVQQLLFSAESHSQTVGSKSVENIGYGENTRGGYVGVATYVPADNEEGTDTFICIFARKASFGPAAMSYQTANDSITWNTPTTTGEFVSPDHKDGETAPLMLEIGEADSEADAIAWCKAMLNWTA